MTLTMEFSDCGHGSGGPSGDADQSWSRSISPIAPPPPRKRNLMAGSRLR